MAYQSARHHFCSFHVGHNFWEQNKKSLRVIGVREDSQQTDVATQAKLDESSKSMSSIQVYAAMYYRDLLSSSVERRISVPGINSVSIRASVVMAIAGALRTLSC